MALPLHPDPAMRPDKDNGLFPPDWGWIVPKYRFSSFYCAVRMKSPLTGKAYEDCHGVPDDRSAGIVTGCPTTGGRGVP